MPLSLNSTHYNYCSLPAGHQYPALPALESAAHKRRRQAFAASTASNHLAQFSTYIQFCTAYNLQDINPSTNTVVLYVEYLAQKFLSHKSVANYISGVRLLHKLLGEPAPALYSFDLSLMLRATRLTMTTPSQQKLPVTPDLLISLCQSCHILGNLGPVIKCALVFGFFAFLRQSNLAPPSAQAFNPRKHTCRGDIIQQPTAILIVLKWTKTIRLGSQPHVIPMPMLSSQPDVCPVRTYQHMTALVPTHTPNDPLLITPPPHRHPLTIAQLSTAFTSLITHLGLDSNSYSLHSLRRGAASTAYHSGATSEAIKQHGTWKSDAMWCYISPGSESQVSTTLADCFQHRS